MYPTGNVAQTGTITMTLTVPVINDGLSNDFLLAAIRSQLNFLADPSSWDDVGFTVTADEAAAYGQSMVDSIVLS